MDSALAASVAVPTETRAAAIERINGAADGGRAESAEPFALTGHVL